MDFICYDYWKDGIKIECSRDGEFARYFIAILRKNNGLCGGDCLGEIPKFCFI